jgi:hypothetical protein
LIKLLGEEVQVFEFPTEQAAQIVMEAISRDGSPIATTLVTWKAAPHFFHSQVLRVIFVGESHRVINEFEDLLDPQFSGR